MGIFLRCKKRKNKYSVYIEVYDHDTGKRDYDYLRIYVSKDYTKPENKRVKKEDKDAWTRANLIFSERQREYILGEYSGTIKKKEGAYFSDFYRMAMQEDQTKNNSSYKYALRRLERFSGEGKRLKFRHITPELLNAWKNSLITDDQLNRNTATMYLERIKIMWRLAIKLKAIQRNPFDDVEIPSLRAPQIEYFTINQLRLMAQAPCDRPQYKALFFLACYTGIGFPEAKRLKWVDVEHGTIRSHREKTKNPISNPLSQTVNEILQKLENDSEYVFTDLPKSGQTVTAYLRNWVKGIEGVPLPRWGFLHKARHTFGTLLAENGESILTIKELLGHKDLKSAQKYIQVTRQIKQNAVEGLEHIDVKL
jgi:integrase